MYFLSPRTIIYQSFSSLLMLHNLLVSYSVKRFTTPSTITDVSANSQIVLGNMLCFGLLSLTRCLLLSLWIVNIRTFIHSSFAYWNTLFYQTQRHSDLPLPMWLVPVDQCLFLSSLCCHLWNLLCHSKCPWMLTQWWQSHPVEATRTVRRSILCRSISKPLTFVARYHKERLR